MTPRPYLSWSQYHLFGSSKKAYQKAYFEGQTFENKYTIFGKEVAQMREKGVEIDGWEHINMFLPDYPRLEHVMTAEVLIDKQNVVLLGRFDGVDLRRHIIGDDKTGLKWTQERADKEEQFTFYSYIYWLNKKVIPRVRVCWIETVVRDGEVVATGKIETFETTRTVQDFINLQGKVNKRWRGIIELGEREWAKVL